MDEFTELSKRKSWLVDEINWKARWYRYVSTLFPDDRRSVDCSHTLRRLAAAVSALPNTHPLFIKLEQMHHANDHVRERWLAELCLEFSHIAWQSAASTQQAIEQLIEITGFCLAEWEHERRGR